MASCAQVGINDGREFSGLLVCFDGDCNLILRHCSETRPIHYTSAASGQSVINLERRQLGLVLVPGKAVTSCTMLSDAAA